MNVTNMDKIPTAEEFFEQGGTYPELAIAFAKLHVKAALEAAAENIKIKQLSLLEIEEAINGYSAEKMADNDCSGVGFPEESHRQTAIKGYIQGFKAHQELVKDKLFTEDDLKRAIDMAKEGHFSNYDAIGYVDWYYTNDQIIQSLQKTEWNIEIVDNKIKLI